MAEKLLAGYKNNIESLILYPSSGGVFEVKSGDKLLFSKKETGRFPEFIEVTELLEK